MRFKLNENDFEFFFIVIIAISLYGAIFAFNSSITGNFISIINNKNPSKINYVKIGISLITLGIITTLISMKLNKKMLNYKENKKNKK
jgi:hypothetical protein